MGAVGGEHGISGWARDIATGGSGLSEDPCDAIANREHVQGRMMSYRFLDGGCLFKPSSLKLGVMEGHPLI